MEPIVIKNKSSRFASRTERGFTLIEVMVTLMILALGMMASMIGIMAALDHSLMNEMRNDAMKLAQGQLEVIRNMPWGNGGMPLPSPNPQNIPIQVRKTTVNYNVNIQTPAIVNNTNPANQAGDALALYQCTVTWKHKGPMDSAPRQYSCVLQSIVRQTK